MADLTRGYTFGATETVTNTKLHNLVDLGAVSNIVNADIASGGAISESKIAFDGSTVVLLGGVQDITGNKTFSGDNTLSGDNIFSGLLNITGNFRMNTPVAGDIFYDDGTNIVRLTKDAEKFLQSTSDGVKWAGISSALFNAVFDPVKSGTPVWPAWTQIFTFDVYVPEGISSVSVRLSARVTALNHYGYIRIRFDPDDDNDTFTSDIMNSPNYSWISLGGDLSSTGQWTTFVVEVQNGHNQTMYMNKMGIVSGV